MLSRCCWWRSPLARLRSSVTACIGRFAIGGRDEDVVDVASPNLPLVTFHVDQLRGKELDFFAQCYDYLSYCHEQEPSQVAQRLMIQLAQQCLRGQPYSQPRTAASTLLFDVVFLPGAIPCFGWFHNEGRLLSSSFADHIGDLWRHQPASLWLLQQNGSSEAGRHHAIYRLLGMRHSSTCEDELRKFHQHNMRWLIGGLMGLKERSAEITMMMYSVNTLCPYYCSRLPSLPPEEWKACVIPEHSLGLRSERILLRHALLSSVGNDVANSNHGSNASLLKVLRTSASTSHECQSICRILLRAGLSVSDAEPPAIVACSPSSSELQRLVHAFWMLDEVQHAQKHMTLIALEVRKLLQQLHAEEEILLAPSLNRDGPLPPRPSVQQQWNEGLVDMKTFASMIQVYGRGFAASHAETADGIITDSATAMVLTGEPVIPTLGLDGDCAWTDALHACDVLCSMLFLDGKAQRRHTSFMADVVALRRALRIRFLLRCGFTTRHHWGSLSNAMRAFPFAEAVELSMRNSATLFCVVFHRGNASNMQPLRLADVFDGQGGVCMALSTLLPRLAPVVLDGGCADNFCSTPGTRTLSADLCFLPEGAQTLTLHLPSEIAEAIQAILGEEKTNDRTVVGLVKHQHRWARLCNEEGNSSSQTHVMPHHFSSSFLDCHHCSVFACVMCTKRSQLYS